MNNEIILSLKRDIQAIGRLMWEKNLATGLNGNISTRIDENTILITATKTCLGLLQEHDIVVLDLEGNVIGEGKASSERLLHTSIYKNFPDVTAVVHTHSTYTNGYFLENDELTPRIFESKFYLGQVKAIPQLTPAVSDVDPVIGALKTNSIVALKNHGVVSIGKDLFDCFLLIQCLEDSVIMDVVSRIYKGTQGVQPGPDSVESKPKKKEQEAIVETKASHVPDKPKMTEKVIKKYKLFSAEQINEIVRLVNQDNPMRELGKKSQMTMELAVKLDETGEVYSFEFKDGEIVDVGKNEGAEFLISASEKIWRMVFNRELDPFVATTQKKMNLRGDFAKISKWYAPCSRIFEIWTQVPVDG